MSEQIPVLIPFAFLIAICFPVYTIASMAKKNAQSNTLFYGILSFYAVYLLAVGIASLNGVFRENTLPPKIIQLTTLPLLVFLMGIVFNSGTYKTLLKNTPVDQFILLHRFRLIGSFFIVLMLFGLLPPVFALIAGSGDIITALSSIWISRLIKNKRKHANKLAIIWNTFGLLDILITSAMAITLTKISMETGALGVDILATFPFCFIPAFAPATIIFLHISIYKKLLAKKIR